MQGDSVKIRDDIQRLFEKVPAMINRYESQVPLIAQMVKHWIKEAKDVLKCYKVPQFSELAVMRGCITAAEQGVWDNSFIMKQNVRQSKVAPAIAIITLKRAQDILQLILDPINRSLDEAKKLLNGIVLITAQKKIITQYSGPDGELTVSVREFWETLAARRNIREALSRVLTIVTYNDAIHLMKECLDELPQYFKKKSGKQLPSEKKQLLKKQAPVLPGIKKREYEKVGHVNH